MSVCVLVPIYDHGDTIADVVDGLAAHGLPCLVVDDGSGASTRAVLDRLAAERSWLWVERRRENGGRGAALKTGYRVAARRGFTHVVQLDADGQHATSDVPLFLEAIARRPDALVLGAPVFDASVPRGRLYGRQLSRAMVWLSTRSFDVADPLCGFRAIPLGPTLEVLGQVPTGDHMEFDPQLVILLHRAGVPVENVPTRVVYTSGGLSHFDMLWDNVRMSRVYARSLAGAFGRQRGRK